MLLDTIIDQPDHWLVTWGFEGEAFEILRRYAEEVSYPARATVFSEGAPPDGMYLILKGMALVIARDASGTERTLSIVTEGQSFGELGLLIGQPRTATVAAGLDLRLLKITPGTLEQLEKERPDLMMRVYKRLAQSLADQWMHGGPWVGRQREEEQP